MATVPNFAISNAQNGSLTAQSTAFTVTPPSTTLAGDACFFQVWNTVSATTPEITSISGGGTWSRVDTVTISTTSMEVWKVENVTAVSSFTVTPALAITGGWNFCEASGVRSSSSLDTSAKASVSSSSWTLSSGNTAVVTDPVCLVMEFDCALNGGIGGGSSVPSGYTNITSQGSGSTHGYMNYKTVVASQAVQSATVTGSSASSSSVMILVAVFRPVPNIIQQKSQNIVSSAASSTVTISAPFTGNLQTLLVSRSSGAGGTIAGAGTVTQTNASWTRVGIIQGTGGTAEVWFSPNASASAGTTITLGNSSAYVYSEWYGLASSGPLDKFVTANTTNAAGTGPTTVVSGSVTNTNSPQLSLISFCGYINQASGSWSGIANGYVILASTTAGGQTIAGAYKVLNSVASTSSSAAFTNSLSTNTSPSLLATFFQSTSSGTGNLMLLGVGA